MSTAVRVVEWGGRGPRLLMLPGLGARGDGFAPLARRMTSHAQVLTVDYPEGLAAARDAGALAGEVADAVGDVDGLLASSMGGLVATHLMARRRARGVAFLGSFSRLGQLGWRARAFALMGHIAVLGRPGPAAAAIAAAEWVGGGAAPVLVPTTSTERWSVWYRSRAVSEAQDPPSLVGSEGHFVAIQGGRDILVPPRTVDQLRRELPPGTPVYVIPDAGHVPYWSHPWDVARLLAPWMQRLG
jgi:pimeloyl-ACP methyl ester carboxylesterase